MYADSVRWRGHRVTDGFVAPGAWTKCDPATFSLHARDTHVTGDVRHQIVDLLPRLRRFALALTGEKDRGDDLVQETCLRALSRLDQWEAGTRLDSWLYRIAQNIWFDNIRALKVRGHSVDVEDVPDLVGDDGRQVTEGRFALNDVASAMNDLPPEQRIVLVLVCIDGLTYKESARILDVPIGTVMSRLARARQSIHVATRGSQVATAEYDAEKTSGRIVE